MLERKDKNKPHPEDRKIAEVWPPLYTYGSQRDRVIFEEAESSICPWHELLSTSSKQSVQSS